MSTRTPEASPYRHHQNHYRYVDPTTGQSHSPESDVGYGTSFGSQDFFLQPQEMQMQNMSFYGGNPQQTMYTPPSAEYMVRIVNTM